LSNAGIYTAHMPDNKLSEHINVVF